MGAELRPAALLRGAHYLSLVAFVGFILAIAREQWFYLDEFVYLGYSRDGFGSVGSLLENYNQHWSTYPILVYRGLRETVGLGAYWPYILVGVVGHLVVVHLLWRLMLRLAVVPLVATALALVVLVSPAAVEHVLWGVNIGFAGSLAAGFACLLLVPLEGGWSRRDRWAVVVATLALPFSSMSVLMAGTVGLVLLLSRGWRIALRFLVVPAAVEAVWAAFYGGSELDGLERAPGFVLDGLRGAGDLLLGGRGPVGALFVLAYLAMLVLLLPTARGPRSMPFALLLSAALCLAIIGTGRAGLNDAGAGRYAYNVVVTAIPAVGVLLTRLAARRAAVVLALAVCVVLTVVGPVQLNRHAEAQAEGEQGVRAQVVGAAAVLRDPNASVVPGAPVGAVLLTLTADDIRRWIDEDRIPALAATEEGVLRAAAEIQVDVGPTPRAAVVDDGCRSIVPGEERRLRPAAPVSWLGRSRSPATLRVGFVESSGVMHTRPILVEGAFYLSDLHPGATFLVTHEGGPPVALCTGGDDA